MRQLAISRPIAVSVVDDQSTYEGGRILKTDSDVDYTVTLERVGEELNETDNTLQIRYKSGKTGGSHDFVAQPRPEGLMPRRFVDPFQFLYAYGDADDDLFLGHWWGQSEKGVKDYYKLDIAPGAYGDEEATALSNYRWLSYNGVLHLLCDAWDFAGRGTYQRVVRLYRQDTDGTFILVKRFDEEPVDRMRSLVMQTGSPDWIIYEDELYVFYRVSDRSRDSNRIVGFKSSGDLEEWTQIADYEVPNTVSAGYNAFRMRVAEGHGVFMIVYYGIRDESSEPAALYEMRTFTSYDLGSSFQDNEGQILGLVEVNSTEHAYGYGSQSLHTLFIPKAIEGDTSVNPAGNTDDVVRLEDYDGGYTVNFDCYFDRTMGSFVILKPGDPTQAERTENLGLPQERVILEQIGNTYLMAIKTVDGDFSSWESCLQMRADYRLTGIRDSLEDYVTSPENEYAAVIQDVCVVPDDGCHTLLLSVKTRDLSFTFVDHGITVSEFKFVDDSQFFPGNYTKLVSYGQKGHERYTFVSSMISAAQSALVSFGYSVPFANGAAIWQEVAGCKHRNQVVASGKMSIDDRVKFYTIVGPWSNMGESVDYQFTYCRWACSPWLLGQFSTTVSGAGSIAYDEDTGFTTCTVTDLADTAYLVGEDGTASVSEAPWIRAYRDFPQDFKTKFTVLYENGPAGSAYTEILSVRMSDPDGHGFKVRLRGDGNIDVVEQDGTLIETVATACDWALTWDFAIKMGTTLDGNTRLSVWVRENGTGTWEWASINPMVPFNAAIGSSTFEIGILGMSSYNGQTVKIGDVACGTASKFYHPVFSKFPRQLEERLEGLDKSQALANGHTEEPFVARHVKCYSNDIELKDGSKIKFVGPVGDKDYGVDYTYSRGRSRNSVLNLVNGIAASVYDFTLTHDEAGDDTTVILRNDNRLDFDTLSLINLVGISGLTVKAGTYDEDSAAWVGTPNEASYTVPYISLELETTVGNMVVLTENDRFATSELLGHTVMVYDGTTYTDQLLVMDNYDGMILCDGEVPALTGDAELRLMMHSASFYADSDLGVGNHSHIGFSFRSSTNATLRQVGEISVGKTIDLSDFVDNDGFSREMDSSFKGVSSNRGFQYLPTGTLGAVLEKAQLKMSTLGRTNDAAERLYRVFGEIFAAEKPFPLIILNARDEVVTRYAVVETGLQLVPENFHSGLTVDLLLHNWRVQAASDYTAENPKITRMSADTTSPTAGDVVSFFTTATDPDGGALTYEWDFGDGNTSVLEDPTHTYVTTGTYLVTLTVTGSTGLTATKNLRVYVVDAGVANYSLSGTYSVLHTAPVDVEIELTLVSLDKDNNTLTDDYSTIITWSVDPEDAGANAGFDGNDDGTYSFDPDTAPADLIQQMVAGSMTQRYMPRTTGSITLTATDLLGREKSVSITIV